MQTHITSQDFSITDGLKAFIKTKAKQSMRPIATQVEQTIVRLKDLNGPKGGQDKECSVEIKLTNLPSVVVRKRSADAYKSIHKALERASRVALRRLAKRRAVLSS